MGVIFDEPKYPVIDPAPGFWRTGKDPLMRDRSGLQGAPFMSSAPHNRRSVSTVGNYGLRDYGTFAGVTALCAPYGYYVGESLHAPHVFCPNQGTISGVLTPSGPSGPTQGARQTCGCHQCGAGSRWEPWRASCWRISNHQVMFCWWQLGERPRLSYFHITCLMRCMWCSAGRLMGLLPNDREVEAGLAKR